ncbi:hypothetical protein [Herbiconiux sp. YIM B11900]
MSAVADGAPAVATLTLIGPAGVVCEGDSCEIPDQAFGVSGSEMSATTAP